MSEQETGQCIPGDDQVAAGLRSAVHAGDIEAVRRLLRNDPALATVRLGSMDAGRHSTRQENVITWLRGLGARSASSD
jgi:hypothetical protein